MKFRLIKGKHVQNDPSGKSMVYSPGDVFESKVNLIDRYGAGNQKFERLSEDAQTHGGRPEKNLLQNPATVQEAAEKGFKDGQEVSPEITTQNTEDDGLEAMTVTELRRWAEAEEIPLDGKTRKDEIIQAIRMAMV